MRAFSAVFAAIALFQMPASIAAGIANSADAIEQPTAVHPSLSLADAVESALRNHPEIRQARAATAGAEASADVNRAPLLPKVVASANYQRATSNYQTRPGALPSSLNQSDTNSFSTSNYFNFALSAGLRLWDFGQSWNLWQAAKASATAAGDNEDDTELRVILTARTAYFAARAAKAMLHVAWETLANQQRHLAQIEGFVDMGTRPAIDLAQARTLTANARVQMITAENGYATAKARLNQAMGVEASGDYEVEDQAFPIVTDEDESKDILFAQALARRPDLNAVAATTRAREIELNAVKSGYWPTLDVSTGLTDGGSEIGNLAWNWQAAANLSWPLFEGGMTRAQSAQATAALETARAIADASRQSVLLQVEQARLAVRAAKAASTAAGEVVINAREQLRLAEGRYETGVGNVLELGDAQLSVTNAAAQQVQADYELATARAELLAALGRR
ncbi:MAG: hypothetical protein A2289_04875 [Deltaproteobacteria bacterium RIFOXYA12_FULL_58_15]|nr:MAG: hypothetical protein A2289_04875 [Deltaproteobacteria bacterium RIFOXYA12_FULL_58_15]OGR10753.1 MAG: hypothetical protein A2341_28480 [Deltaproteobacteria bacterium RIFOXYB12_FULL_58_9]